MKANVGTTDKIFRLIAGLAGLFAGYTFQSVLAYAAGAILIVTALVGFCPLYRLFGFSTRAVRQPSRSPAEAAAR